MLLIHAEENQKVIIVAIKDESLKIQLMKRGLQERATIHILQKVPNGPALLGFGSQEIVLGNEFLKMIVVSLKHV